MIDSHCHLTSPELLPNVDAVIERARAAGVADMVTIAVDLEDAARAFAVRGRHFNVHVAAGVHPHEAGKVHDGWDAALWEIVARPDVLAVGETGLDYHYDFADQDAQARVFRRQLEIAAEARKPVVIHCREAHADAMRMLAEFAALPGVVFHCFTGTEDEAAAILDRGYWLSLTGVVTFKKSDALRSVARMIPSDRLMLETDSPYLSPEPVRHVRPNEPAHLVHTAACIAAARGMELAELAAISAANTRRFFSIPAIRPC